MPGSVPMPLANAVRSTFLRYVAPELLILDDFSLGLDPGYRRLFVDYLRDYARSENKTVFLTSHIIQDMERLIDDCIIMDYGSILIQQPIETLMKELRRYTCTVPEGYQPQLPATCYHPAVIRQTLETYSFWTITTHK